MSKYKSIDELPKTTNTKDKVKKSFSLSKEAVEVYEAAKLKGINSTRIVEDKIEEALKDIKHLVLS